MIRTQIYLQRDEHAALIKESRRLGISLAGMVRTLIDDYIDRKNQRPVSREEQIQAALSIISIGDSKLKDVSTRHDDHLGQAIYEDIRSKDRILRDAGRKLYHPSRSTTRVRRMSSRHASRRKK